MNRLKRLTILSTAWNLVLFGLLFFQTNLIYSIVEKNLFPTLKFLKPLFDRTIIEFIKNRIIITVISIIIMIIIEIILFLVINKIFQKKYKECFELQEKINLMEQSKKSIMYYKWINIYLITFILIFLGVIIYYSLNFLSYSNKIELNMNNKTIKSLYEIIRNIKLSNLADIEDFINISIEKIKNDSEIYKLIIEFLNFIDVMYYINILFYNISYLLLGFGIYKNIRMYFSLNRKEEKNDKKCC